MAWIDTGRAGSDADLMKSARQSRALFLFAQRLASPNRVAEGSDHPQPEMKNETTRTTHVIDTRRIGSSVSPTENARP